MENKKLEERRCKLCGEFHNVDDERAFSGSDHDMVQASTVWECDKKQFPDDEAFKTEPTYKIVRFFHDDDKESKTIETGLTLEEAQAHCNDPKTRKEGEWFDGYEEE